MLYQNVIHKSSCEKYTYAAEQYYSLRILKCSKYFMEMAVLVLPSSERIVQILLLTPESFKFEILHAYIFTFHYFKAKRY